MLRFIVSRITGYGKSSRDRRAVEPGNSQRSTQNQTIGVETRRVKGKY
jgi:hypothetical protein